MTEKEAGMIRWLCQIYAGRGHVDDREWDRFKKFCVANNLDDEPTPGRRVDGRNPWDVFEEKLVRDEWYKK